VKVLYVIKTNTIYDLLSPFCRVSLYAIAGQCSFLSPGFITSVENVGIEELKKDIDEDEGGMRGSFPAALTRPYHEREERLKMTVTV